MDSGSTISDSNIDSELFTMNADMEVIDPESQVELEEKTRLINQVLELQHTLEDFVSSLHEVLSLSVLLQQLNTCQRTIKCTAEKGGGEGK
ncbi:short coiled-coil protein isoform X2 [Pristis pectinata]|uniref:short coiled-coil protein isoform X2 n=1 Tax=Pristis pectinata TaxID=685728 RepID=UPI00223D3231|nr:short coiled-coil protein isoform X2 [Pristis pectinata]